MNQDCIGTVVIIKIFNNNNTKGEFVMPFRIIQNDITTMKVDAIVNAANKTLLGGGGVDGAIHRCAGPELLKECRTLHGCETGEAKITKGYRLPASYVIHTVGPIYVDGKHNERQLLTLAYRNSLHLAKKHHLHSIAFPLISSGIYGYPKEEAIEVAISTIKEFLETDDMDVTLVIFDKKDIPIGKAYVHEIKEYIDEHYIASCHKKDKRNLNLPVLEERCLFEMEEGAFLQKPICSTTAYEKSLEDCISNLDESFSESLFHIIDEKGYLDTQVYKKANLDRKLFSKIRTNRDYRPSKETAIALAISLQLNLSDTQNLLAKAGYTLSNSNKFDVIIRYFIEHHIFDIYKINETLFSFDQKLLG